MYCSNYCLFAKACLLERCQSIFNSTCVQARDSTQHKSWWSKWSSAKKIEIRTRIIIFQNMYFLRPASARMQHIFVSLSKVSNFRTFQIKIRYFSILRIISAMLAMQTCTFSPNIDLFSKPKRRRKIDPSKARYNCQTKIICWLGC